MVHLYSYTLNDCVIVLPRCWEQATKEGEDRVGGDQGSRVVVDRFPNFEVGVFMFLKLLVSNAR